MIECCAYTKRGNLKEKNEDKIFLNEHLLNDEHYAKYKSDELLAVLCDGVGGVEGGDIAAEMVALSFENFKVRDASPLSVVRHLNQVNHQITIKKLNNINTQQMATTVAGIMFVKNRFMLFNIGDTRIYEFDEGKLKQISRDHILFNEIKDSCCESRNIITRYIGGNGKACSPYIRTGKSNDNSYYLICSDGIYKSISEVDLNAILLNKKSLEEKIRTILKLSSENGSTDDKSIVLIKKT